MKPSVDIIIPTYNRLNFLEKAVESVLGQEHRKFNLYVVDDGSTDSGATKKFVTGLGDNRVHYLKKKNGGPSSARNLGVRSSNAPLVAFLDADDWWHPQKLAKQVDLMEKHKNLGLVYCWCRFINSNGEIVGQAKSGQRGELFRRLLSGNKITGSASAVLVRREVLENVGIFREDSDMGEDWELWLRIARKYRIDYVPEVLVDIRVHPASAQADHRKVASGLVHIRTVILGEFNLNLVQRSAVAAACLRPAMVNYLGAGDRLKAKKILKQLNRSPLSLLTVNRHFWTAYLRLALGNKMLRSIRSAILNK